MTDGAHLASEDGRDTGAREHQPAQLQPINWLSRLVTRVPIRIRTKLLVSLAVMVVVLVIIGGVGLRVLGESNARFRTLATLQENAATYRALQNQNSQLRSLLAARTSLFPGVSVPSDETVESTLRQFRGSYDLRQRVTETGRDERELVAGIRADYEQLVTVMDTAVELNRAGRTTDSQELQRDEAVPLSDRIVGGTDPQAGAGHQRRLPCLSMSYSSVNVVCRRGPRR